ncbi:MAG: triose-phosphate isomerase [Pseudomonadota bacterium]
MRTPLIAGNWKLNGNLVAARALASEIVDAGQLGEVDLLVCPSFTLLSAVNNVLSGSSVALGAQNLSGQPEGAFTGEVSGDMLAECGCAFVIVGHSERRTLFGETDADVSRKVDQALASGLTPIVCVGESLAERDDGRAFEVVRRQLDGALSDVSDAQLEACVLAYEPVWAIGTGRSASPEQAQAVHAEMRDWLSRRGESIARAVRTLYGGSVKPDNAGALFAQPDVDGALVGGASLVGQDFLAIARAAAA